MDEHNVIRISRRVLPWFEEAFRIQALGQRVAWEAVFGIGQDQGRMIPVFLIYVELPAHQLGHVHTQIAQLGVLGLTEAGVQAAVSTMLGKLHELRRAELDVSGNGGNGVPGGLVIGRG